MACIKIVAMVTTGNQNEYHAQLTKHLAIVMYADLVVHRLVMVTLLWHLTVCSTKTKSLSSNTSNIHKHTHLTSCLYISCSAVFFHEHTQHTWCSSLPALQTCRFQYIDVQKSPTATLPAQWVVSQGTAIALLTINTNHLHVGKRQINTHPHHTHHTISIHIPYELTST